MRCFSAIRRVRLVEMTALVSDSDNVGEEIARLEAQLGTLRQKRDKANRACAGVELSDHNCNANRKGAAKLDLRRQKHLRRGIIPYLRDYNWRVILTGPVIYATFLALVILDIAITLYMWICFPVYRIEKVRRADYILIDRHQLAYLNLLEKLNCAFCGYANGLFAYGLEIASRTERFWCPIKHAAQMRGSHHRTTEFVDYNDGTAYRVLQRKNAAATRAPSCSGGHCNGCGN